MKKKLATDYHVLAEAGVPKKVIKLANKLALAMADDANNTSDFNTKQYSKYANKLADKNYTFFVVAALPAIVSCGIISSDTLVHQGTKEVSGSIFNSLPLSKQSYVVNNKNGAKVLFFPHSSQSIKEVNLYFE